MSGSSRLKPRKMAKRVSRLNAVQALFQMEASNQGMEYVIRGFVENGFGSKIDEIHLPPSNKSFFEDLLNSAVNNQQTIDRVIHSQLPTNWTIDRIDPTIRAIFRSCCAEILIDTTPINVIINEYVEISKSFFSETKQIGFVNAIIENMTNELDSVSLKA